MEDSSHKINRDLYLLIYEQKVLNQKLTDYNCKYCRIFFIYINSMISEAQITLNKIQAGSLAFSQTIDECLLVVGHTKAGKTTSCHILCQSPLLITQKYGQGSYTLDKNSSFPTAQIGQTPLSQTQFPNIFKANVYKMGKNSSTIICDCPGFGDNFGFNRILSNGYFQYQIFSKASKIKFLLVIDKSDLTTGGGERLRKLIVSFVNFFTHFQEIKQNILNATSFLITKVDSSITTNDMKDLMIQLKNAFQKMSNLNNKKTLSEIINNVVKKDKIFLMRKPKKTETAQKGGNILVSILQSLVFWQRKKEKNGMLNMKNINSSISYQVLDELGSNKDNQKFNQHFDEFMSHLKIRRMNVFIKNQFSVQNIVALLQKDVLDANDVNKYLEGMQKFINQNDYFDERYKQSRKKKIICQFINIKTSALFQNPQNTAIKQIKKMNCINKFQILEFIQLQSQKVELSENNILSNRTMSNLDFMDIFFINMFNKIQSCQLEDKYQHIIYRYAYIIKHMIEEQKILMKILFGNDANKKKFDSLKRSIILGADLFDILKKVITQFDGIDIPDLKKTYIQNLFLNKSLNSNIVNIQLIDFLESCKILSKDSQIQISYLIINYYNNNNIPYEQLCIIGQKAYNYRILFENQIVSSDNFKNAIFDVSQLLTHILVSLGQFGLAVEIHQNIINPQGIFQIYNQRLRQTKGQLFNQQLIYFGKLAASYFRTQLALSIFQNAYNNSRDNNERKIINKLIASLLSSNNLNNNPNNNKNNSYLQRVSKDQFSSKISSGLSKRIMAAFNKKIE